MCSTQQQAGTLLFAFDKITVLDAHSITITTPEENLLLPYILSHPYMGIGKAGDKPVGTGPFKFVLYKKDQLLETARNEDYWGDEAASAGIVFRLACHQLDGLCQAGLSLPAAFFLQMNWAEMLIQSDRFAGASSLKKKRGTGRRPVPLLAKQQGEKKCIQSVLTLGELEARPCAALTVFFPLFDSGVAGQ